MEGFLQQVDLLKVDFDVKIGDLGFSKFVVDAQNPNFTICGTPLYMSPQIVHEEEYTFKTDIWSLGCLFFELLTGNTPFQSKSMKQLSKHMSLGAYQLTVSERPSMETIYLLASCLLNSEVERISTAALAEHPYMNLKNPLTPFNPQD